MSVLPPAIALCGFNHSKDGFVEQGRAVVPRSSKRPFLGITHSHDSPYLLRVAVNKSQDGRLFGRNRQALWETVHRLCAKAGVPLVCTYSLRGLWATLAVESGQAYEAVAAALGHGSFAVTAKHYAQPSALPGTPTDRVGEALFRNRSTDPN